MVLFRRRYRRRFYGRRRRYSRFRRRFSRYRRYGRYRRGRGLTKYSRTALISQLVDCNMTATSGVHNFGFFPSSFNGDAKLDNIKARYDRYTLLWMKVIVYPPKPNHFEVTD